MIISYAQYNSQPLLIPAFDLLHEIIHALGVLDFPEREAAVIRMPYRQTIAHEGAVGSRTKTNRPSRSVIKAYLQRLGNGEFA